MATRFLDGPAAGVSLALRRAPLFLRAVRKPDGSWDALDLLDDNPAAEEEVTVYVLVENPSMVHLQMAGPGGRGRRCRWEAFAAYRFADPQPDEAAVRDRERWRAWAVAEQKRLREGG